MRVHVRAHEETGGKDMRGLIAFSHTPQPRASAGQVLDTVAHLA